MYWQYECIDSNVQTSDIQIFPVHIEHKDEYIIDLQMQESVGCSLVQLNFSKFCDCWRLEVSNCSWNLSVLLRYLW